MNWLVRRRRWLEIALVALVIVFAAARRLEFLDERPLWVDEAESSINALTILQHGMPVDHYLGLPIYENTLVKPWPGNPEYEFKDISYSDRGLATYHGWLPLYAMAASFAVNGVAPDALGDAPSRRTLADLKWRSRVARLPAVFFSAIFLALCYGGGTVMFGRDAGWAALLAGSLHQTQMDLSTTARYYSATLALSTAAVICLWLMLRKRRWRDYIAGALVFSLLFYTHLVTFAAAAAVFCAVALCQLREPSARRKLLFFCAILAALTVPWMLATGFLSGLGAVPPARTLLSFPRDFIRYPLARLSYFLCLGAFAALCMLAAWRRYAPPERLRAVVQQLTPPALLLAGWTVCGYAAFLLLMPAASFFPERLSLSYWGPLLLLGTILCTALCRLFVSRRINLVVAPLATLLVLTVTGHNLQAVPSPDPGHKWNQYAALNNYFQSHPIAAGARLFGAPNEHLTLTFYTGRPFQSIAPVRKSFLDSCTDEIIYVERKRLVPDSSPGPVSPATKSRTLPAGAMPPAAHENQPPDLSIPILRGFHITNWDQWSAVFFYRYVNPMSRIGRNANYAARLRDSQSDLLTGSNWAWAVYYSKPPASSGLRP